MTEREDRGVFGLQKQQLPIDLHILRVSSYVRGVQRHTRSFNPISPSCRTSPLTSPPASGADTSTNPAVLRGVTNNV